MSTYVTKFAFLLKDNNNKTCHRIYSSVHAQHIYKSDKGVCIFIRFLRGGALNQTRVLIYFKSYLPWPLFKHAPVRAEALIRMSTVNVSIFLNKNRQNSTTWHSCHVLLHRQ